MRTFQNHKSPLLKWNIPGLSGGKKCALECNLDTLQEISAWFLYKGNLASSSIRVTFSKYVLYKVWEALSKFFVATQSNTQIVATPPHVCGSHGTVNINLWHGLCQVTAIDVQSSFNFQNYFENPLAKFFFGLLAVHTKGRYFASMLHLGCKIRFQPVLANY